MKTNLNIRQLINAAKLPEDTQLLIQHGVVSDKGNLTDLGRRVLCDILFSDADIKAQVIEAIRNAAPVVE